MCSGWANNPILEFRTQRTYLPTRWYRRDRPHELLEPMWREENALDTPDKIPAFLYAHLRTFREITVSVDTGFRSHRPKLQKN